MGMKKWVLIVLVCSFPASVLGAFNSDPYYPNSTRFSPDKVAFPVSPKLIDCQSTYRFELSAKTLAVREINTGTTKFVDTNTGLVCEKPSGFQGEVEKQLCASTRGLVELVGNPPTLIAQNNKAYFLDSDRYITLSPMPQYEHENQYLAQYFDHGQMKASMTVCRGIGQAQVIGDTLIVHSNNTLLSLYNLKTGKSSAFDYVYDERPTTRSWPSKGKYMLIGRTLVDFENQIRFGYVGENPVFYKDYVISRTNSFKDDETGKYVSEIRMQTMDLKVVSGKTWNLPFASFHGSLGNFVYGVSGDPDNQFFIMKVPAWKITYSIPSGVIFRLIGDDGKRVLIQLDGKVVAVNPESGKADWEYPLNGFVYQMNEYSFTINGSVYVYKRQYHNQNSYLSTISRIEEGKSEVCMQWEYESTRRYNIESFSEFTPFEDGFIKVPNWETDVPISIFDINGKLIKEIAIPELMKEKLLSFVYDGGYLYANSAGMNFYRIDIKTGKYDIAKLSDKAPPDKAYEFSGCFGLKVGEKYIVAQNSSGKELVFDKPTLYPFRYLEDFGSFIINGELLVNYNHSKIYIINQDKYIDLPKETSIGPVLGDKIIFIFKGKVEDELTKIEIIDQEGKQEFREIRINGIMNYGHGFTFGDDFITYLNATGITDNVYKQSMESFPFSDSYLPIKYGFVGTDLTSVWKFAPCPVYTIKRINESQFQIENNRSDGLGGDLIGAYSLCSWGSSSGFPDLSKMGRWVSFGSIKPGEKKAIKIDLDEIKSGNIQFGKLALVVESNGFLDAREVSPRQTWLPQFDGFRSIDPEKILSLSVWDEQP